jgi:DNA gyrase/topoisomerase IV subunit A
MVLVNGNEGIGTGWSSKIPNYNPRDIVENLKRLLRGEPLQLMIPWYRGFKVNFHSQQSYCYITSRCTQASSFP